jgi:hypothetical protein
MIMNFNTSTSLTPSILHWVTTVTVYLPATVTL